MLTGDGMAELDKGKPVSFEELMVSTLAMTDGLGKAVDRERRHHGCGVQAEAAGGAGGVSAHSESDSAITTERDVTPAKAHFVRDRV
jgi:hypothetical protein